MKTDTAHQTPAKEEADEAVASHALLACPFCGQAPNITQIGNAHTRKRGIKIKCPTLGCVEFRTCVIRHSLEWAEQKAREKWNGRFDPANDERMHHYQRGRASITGLVLKLRGSIETGRLVVVVMTRLVRH
jgi:hypothetical protein